MMKFKHHFNQDRNNCWALMAHACDPSYSGGSNQEDRDLKPAQANSLRDPISKTLHKNMAGGVTQGEGLEFKSQYSRKKKE
jgi:hypothetical protein